MVKRRWAIVGMLVVLAAFLAGCEDMDDLFGSSLPDEVERSRGGVIEAGVEPGEIVTLTVASKVGDVTIEPHDGDRVVVEYKLTAYAETAAEAEAELDGMAVTLIPNGAHFLLDATQTADEGDNRSNTIDLTIGVPAQVNLDLTHNVGDVTIRRVTLPDTLKVAQNVGSIVLADVTADGPAEVHNDVGDVRFSGALNGAGPHTFRVNTGSIALALPSDASGELDAVAGVGDVTVRGFTLRDRVEDDAPAHAELQGTLGEGGPSIALRTSVGDITLEAR